VSLATPKKGDLAFSFIWNPHSKSYWHFIELSQTWFKSRDYHIWVFSH